MRPPDLIAEASAAVAWIVPQPDGRYVTSGSGKDGAIDADVVEIEDRHGEIFDIAAWAHDDPGRWWLRTGHGSIIGADAIERSGEHGTPVYLVTTPRAWIDCRTRGLMQTACVLQWNVRLWPLLSEAWEVRCSTRALANQLARTLREQGPGFAIRTIKEFRNAA